VPDFSHISRRRLLRDRFATVLINCAGIGVIALVVLILAYLVSVALPLLDGAQIAEPVRLQDAPEPLPRQSLRSTGPGIIEFSTGPRQGSWVIGPGAGFRCNDGPLQPLPESFAAPPVAASLAEGEDVLLLLASDGALHRLALSRQGCALTPLHGLRPQPFVPDTLLSESLRPVALLIDGRSGRLRLLNSVTGATLYAGSLPRVASAADFSLSADGSTLQGRTDSGWMRWRIRNLYPEAGVAALWLPQSYAGYGGPAQIWHPGGEGVGAQSKYSLVPLLFGTFKAACYGMLLALPIALGAAIYTGYFLPQPQRNRVKPAVEMLEAFPTVVLGFLAGLWLAPLLEAYLLCVFLLPLILLAVPLLLAAGHLLLQRLSPRFITRPPRILLLLLSYLLLLAPLFALGPEFERSGPGAALRDGILSLAGVQYEQRNALLVGLAMGLALIPTVFSIMEDAVFAVPRSLSDGSLALGATRWQSLARVVLPAAAPAILSAALIGLARGLGETMIVLLATGNTPIIDASLFTGLRSLSASLAIELPEASVGGLQFRVLFLGSLVLFALTFLLNTVAELFRQRLRYRYAGR
jgi:phosphate transport system permease protein